MSEWQKRERLEATIAGDMPDRAPVTLWRHFPGDDQDAQAQAAAHAKWQKDYDWDLVKVSPASSYCLVDWGVKDRWEGTTEGTRTYTRRVVEDPGNWEALRVLNPREGMLATQIEALDILGQELGRMTEEGATPYIATIFAPLAQAKNLAGQQRMLSHMRAYPDLFRRGLQAITDSTIAYIETAKEAGISGIFFAIQHARYAVMSPAEYQTFGRPYDEQVLAAADDLWLNMVHIHGDEDIMFDLVADYPVQIINWHDRDSRFSLTEGLEQFPSVVSGGVSRWSLYEESPEQAIAEAREALRQTSGRRHLLGVGCVAMTNTPHRNIRALRQVVDQI